jgi:LysM repeat protein
VSGPPVNGTAQEYIASYKDLAISEMRRTGVPASITLAQGMLESDYGRSSLARLGNNHFGIKCHNDWKGQTMRQHDDRRNECFRKYSRPEDSYYDHSDFLKSGSRYRFLFDLNPLDYKAWARGLKKAGYATNPDYANMLIKKIEENQLYNYDSNNLASVVQPSEITKPEKIQDTSEKTNSEPVITGTSAPPQATQGKPITFGDVMAKAPRIMENNRVRYIVVKDGETKEKIEKEFQLLKWELARFNDLDENFSPFAGQILYLDPKKDKAEQGIDFHTATEGETMHSISQKYAIKLKSLLEMNRMGSGSNPVVGQKIWLQEIKPAD